MLPAVSAQEVINVLRKLGYEKDRQRGSHIIMRQVENPYRRITIPNHREIAKGTLRAIIREAGLSVDDFIRLL
jgi:predicted RNA binding protein YcfA (HicA-like mRNA interferase family)